MNLNKVLLIGRLTADPQLRTTTSGQSVASFGLATNSVWIDKAGAKQEATEFHNIVVWGRQAETTSKFLTKGALALIEGRLQTRSWTDKEGGQRKTTEIVADRVQFGPKPMGGGVPMQSRMPSQDASGTNAAQATHEASPTIELPVIDISEGEIKAEDLPF